jgi:hypothetical protein
MKVGDVLVCYNVKTSYGRILREITIGNKYVFFNRYKSGEFELADIRNMEGTFIYLRIRVTSLDRFFKVFEEIEEVI